MEQDKEEDLTTFLASGAAQLVREVELWIVSSFGIISEFLLF